MRAAGSFFITHKASELTMDSIPRFLQGIFPFTGEGMTSPFLLSMALAYAVPSDKRAQLIYLRAGNSADELITLILMRDGKPMRYFPFGAKDAMHVPLAVVEDLQPETRLELHIAAPTGTSGTLVLDMGLVEIV